MRSTITISLPEPMAKDVRKQVKLRGFASASEYFRHILREYREAQLSDELHEQQKAFERGEGKLLKKLSDLDR